MHASLVEINQYNLYALKLRAKKIILQKQQTQTYFTRWVGNMDRTSPGYIKRQMFTKSIKSKIFFNGFKFKCKENLTQEN